MSKAARLTVAISVAAILAGLPLSAMAQQPEPPKKPAPRAQPNHPQGGQPPHAGPAPAAQIRPQGPPGQVRGPGPEVHAVHAIGERGYSFRGPDHGRRDVATFNERERAVWYGGHLRHERHFGRLGYWWEVNGVWYYYDQPFVGPPTYVSDVEFMDEGIAPYAPVVVGQPAPVVVVPPPVVYVPPPAPPPVVCVGPLCVR